MPENAFHRITDTEDRWYKPFWDIYTVSFPVYEQRDESQQLTAFNDERYYLLANIENDTLQFFVACWDFTDYVYIEHLAVNPDLRGKNIGSIMLDTFAKTVQKTVLLEIDPITDSISEKRFRFYEKLGYKLNPYKHAHPAYKEGYKPHELLVLSLNKTLTKEEYKQFENDLKHIVMKF
ncbi:N-acetyltransferase [Prevotella sp. 10(H)]|uniref:GNAT family N-acetyltransferase n=1 Tax=Prevotella sp. 10(H) TaxID=1158294 RepID=UPI0004A7128A|nr:GNAT family N-acetyltransferase [Prevotella sp. 10(H)]